jgi:hypothetical protein
MVHVEVDKLYSSPNIMRMIRARRMGWEGRGARLGEEIMYTRFWWGQLKETDHLGDLGVDCKIILKWILQIKDAIALIGFIWLGFH